MQRPRRYQRYAEDDDVRGEIQRRVAVETGRGSRTVVAAILTVSTFLLIATLSLYQLTGPEQASRLLRDGIAAATEGDMVVQSEGESFRRFAETTDSAVLSVPGYPVKVVVTREEATSSSNEELAELLLARSTALVYREGLSAFDSTGRQDIGLFSPQGMLDALVSVLNPRTHDRAGTAAMLCTVIAGLSALVVVVQNAGYTRFKMLGIAVFLGAAPGLGLSYLAMLIAQRAGGDDPFVEEVRALVEASINVPLRNYLIVTAVALGIALMGAGLSVAGRFLSRRSTGGDFEADFDAL